MTSRPLLPSETTTQQENQIQSVPSARKDTATKDTETSGNTLGYCDVSCIAAFSEEEAVSVLPKRPMQILDVNARHHSTWHKGDVIAIFFDRKIALIQEEKPHENPQNAIHSSHSNENSTPEIFIEPQFPEHASKFEKISTYRALFGSTIRILVASMMASECLEHASFYMKNRPPETWGDSCLEYWVTFHNEVNQRKHKPLYSTQEVRIAYEKAMETAQCNA